MNKFETLIELRTKLTLSYVLPIMKIHQSEIVDEPQLKMKIQRNFLANGNYIVRSSHSSEDSTEKSGAGYYLSVPNVNLNTVIPAIISVFNSYGNDADDQIVIIQPYLSETKRSGVIFSHNPDTGEEYISDNYTQSADTTAITSGNIDGFIRKCYTRASQVHSCHDEYCLPISKVMAEISSVLQIEYLDVEYAIDLNDEIVIFQVRPLLIRNPRPKDLDIAPELNRVYEFISGKQKEVTLLSGVKTVYGIMPDWNPAEIIGRKPKKLALSLYKELITDSIWAYQRDNYGYKTLRSHPLLVEFVSQPYIDIRVSFNSLLPKGLSQKLETKLIDFYIEKLAQNSSLHDKIEFEIVLSSWTFDLDEKLANLPEEITLQEKELLSRRLIELTRNVMLGELLHKDIERIDELGNRFRSLSKEELNPIDEIYWLLEDCKRWGTLPFAGLARGAFIATQILKSAEEKSQQRDLFVDFFQSIDTVTSRMGRDLSSLSKTEFIKEYGHLRPGTYDIASPSYAEGYDRYFSRTSQNVGSLIAKKSHAHLIDTLNSLEIENAIGIDAEEFIDFAKKSIFWREQAKFEFSKNLSRILWSVAEAGKVFGFTKEDMSYLDINDLLKGYSSSMNLQVEIESSIAKGRHLHRLSTQVELPALICNPGDVYGFVEKDSIPNFITLKEVTGQPVSINEDVAGRIVVLERADPGFDWIFQKSIKGLITAYGGANSHMAIRCSELDLPAVIGVGERVFTDLLKAKSIHINSRDLKLEYK